VRRLYDGVISTGRTEDVDTVAEDYVQNSGWTPDGRAAFASALAISRAAMPDGRALQTHMVAENNRLASRSVWDGTITESGRPADFTSLDFSASTAGSLPSTGRPSTGSGSISPSACSPTRSAMPEPAARNGAGDPSNPVAFDQNGRMTRTLPDGQSAGSVVVGLLPASAHHVKAFGTLGADALASGANREPRRAVLFYATDDQDAAATIEQLIRAAGFEPVKAGGVADAGRIEAPGGDLHQSGRFHGKLVDTNEASAAVAAGVPT
jgi:hypothetical protein